MKIKRRFYQIICLLSFGLLLSISFSYFGYLDWKYRLFSHFVLQYSLISLAFSLVFFCYKKKVPAIFLLLVFISQTIRYSDFENIQNVNPPQKYDSIRFFAFNVAFDNTKPEKTIDWIIQNHEKIDIIVLSEIVPIWIKPLKKLKKLYPHHKIKAQELDIVEFGHYKGMAVFSKIETDIEFDNILKDINISAHIRGTTSNHKIPFYIHAVHNFSPILYRTADASERFMDRLGDILAKEKTRHKIIIGDFNSTPWNSNFQRIIRKTNLHYSGNLFSHKHSWPTFLPASFRIPIDHVFVSENIYIKEKYLGEDFGSDHFPLITTVHLKAD